MALSRVGHVACRTVGFDVDCGGVEVRDPMEKLVLDAVRDLVRGDDVEYGVDTDGEVGLETVSFPTDANVAHGRHAGRVGCGVFDAVDEFGIDAIHESAEDLAHRDA
jgi:hypothetical protein